MGRVTMAVMVRVHVVSVGFRRLFFGGSAVLLMLIRLFGDLGFGVCLWTRGFFFAIVCFGLGFFCFSLVSFSRFRAPFGFLRFGFFRFVRFCFGRFRLG